MSSSTSYIKIHNLCYLFPDNSTLFSSLSTTFGREKIGLIGKNGAGKSTLLQLIAQELQPSSGTIAMNGKLAYLPQNPIIAGTTIAGVFGHEEKIQALENIKNGSTALQDFNCIGEDWDVEQRLSSQLKLFNLENKPLLQPINELSGGELTQLLLAQAFFSNTDFLLLDEPTNHLDSMARQQLYTEIAAWPKGMIIASHDRHLLNQMDGIAELNCSGLSRYGGNYDFYQQQKQVETRAQEQQVHDAKKILKKNQQNLQVAKEKREQRQSYGRDLRKKSSIDKISANAAKGRSERTLNSLLTQEHRLINQANTQLQTAKEKIQPDETIHLTLPKTYLPNDKIILDVQNCTFNYPLTNKPVIDNFSFTLKGPQRVGLVGCNGSGKTTLVKLIMGELIPNRGTVYRGTNRIRYLDQTISILDKNQSVLENFLLLNPEASVNDAHHSLAWFLFKNQKALKKVKELSGGEQLRACLACVLLAKQPPQLLILDEPTNHLDLQSVMSIESALKNYLGALLIISHDASFLENCQVTHLLTAPFKFSGKSISTSIAVKFPLDNR